jgi:Trk K+ transport system NAD-binding subunit
MTKQSGRNHRQREVRALWRDRWILITQFKVPLILFFLVIVSASILFLLLSRLTNQPISNFPEALYLVISMIFLQGYGEFPSQWFLQIFFFIMPVIGISIIAQGLTEFSLMFFNRRARGKEWEVAVASTMNNHIILVGLGHLGFRVTRKLHEMNQDIVVIELGPAVDLVDSVKSLGVPVIMDNATRDLALQDAGISRARAIILCTQNDSLNLHIALKARSFNPQIQVIVRIFEDDFASELESQFGFHALSATGMAAPLFAAIATDMDITPPILIEGKPQCLARMEIQPGSLLSKRSIESIEQEFDVSIVAHVVNGLTDLHPDGAKLTQMKDTIAVLGPPQTINRMVHANIQ